ncbi:MAG: transglutaminase domain-containing protein [Parcubacteria group bacterium Athens0714_26]|nr:MAG: transglutaminase domain-containing protein [Parcubacteria group bacterium Athens0714_26]
MHKFKIIYTATFHLEPKSAVHAWLALPINSFGQQIVKTSLNFTPLRADQNSNDNTIIHTSLQEPGITKLTATIDATLKQYAVQVKNLNYLHHKKIVNAYTKNESFLEKTKQLKSLATKIKHESRDNLHALHMAFEHTVNSFSYCYPVQQRGVKKLQFDNLKGDCGEYTSFFVTLCRAMGIPARPSTGFVVSTKGKLLEHAWASVYVPGYGWCDIDTQYAALEQDIRQATEKYFLIRSDYRIAFSNGYNLPLHPTIPLDFSYSYWQQQYLPMSRKTVQVLQPIVFASRGKVKFSDTLLIK